MRIKVFVFFVLSFMILSGCACDDFEDSGKSLKIIAEKPVIYLYGYDNEDVTIKLDLDGKMGATFPQISKTNRWEFKAENDGILDFNGDKYRYIFWEGSVKPETFSFSTGYCVAGSDMYSFLDEKLDSFHFTSQEKEDFITYWLPRMKDNKYNVISFQGKGYTESAKLTVTPKPDKTIRIFMAWYPSDTKVEIPEQNIKVPKRSGKVLVEWGGCNTKQNDTASTETVSNDNITQETPEAIQPEVVTDPYAIYGEMAQCAKDWDSHSISNAAGKWAAIDASTQQQAYFHWQHYGPVGW